MCYAVFIEYRNVTDGRTDGQNCYINVARQCADARQKRNSYNCNYLDELYIIATELQLQYQLPSQ